MDARAIVRHIGGEKLHRLDAEDPDEFERTIGAYIDHDEDYESIRTEILELIRAENPPLTGDDLDMFIQGVKEESKQNTGGTKVRITESRLREIIKEEISNMVSEGAPHNVYMGISSDEFRGRKPSGDDSMDRKMLQDRFEMMGPGKYHVIDPDDVAGFKRFVQNREDTPNGGEAVVLLVGQDDRGGGRTIYFKTAHTHKYGKMYIDSASRG